jgi:cytochrome bd-type quinol oxidase subunit 1
VVRRKATTYLAAILVPGVNETLLAALTIGGLNAALLSSASAATCVTGMTATFANVINTIIGEPGADVVTAVTPTMAAALTNVTATPGPVPFLTSATPQSAHRNRSHQCDAQSAHRNRSHQCDA